MKPLISYYGGKQRIASQIIPYIEAIPHTVYAEPFAGGLAVFYARNKPVVSNGDHYREYINDTDENLIRMYRVARENPPEFSRWIQLTPYSQAEYKQACKILKEPDQWTEIRLAWAYYVNVQMSFAKIMNTGWGASTQSVNEADTWASKQNRLPECLDRLRNVYISCEDALKLIERVDSPQTVLYCDPPYPGAYQGHYEGYTLDDWQSLCDALDNCQSSYVLSNYPQSIEPKSAQQRVEIRAVCSGSGKGKVGKGRDKSRAATSEELGDRERTEVLWICDRSSGMRKELERATRRAKQQQLSFL